MSPQPDITQAMTGYMSLPDIVTLVFYLTATGYIIFSIILHYHWQQYGTNKAVTWVTMLTYGLSTVPIILLMAALTFSF